jgi:hypothetical protein
MRRLLLVVAALSLALTACRSAEQRLVDRRRELRSTLGRAYGDWAASTPQGEPAPDAGVLGMFASQVDRALFESQCLATGRGERALPLSPRLDAFLREDRNARTCRKAADLQLEVDALEREVAAAGGAR